LPWHFTGAAIGAYTYLELEKNQQTEPDLLYCLVALKANGHVFYNHLSLQVVVMETNNGRSQFMLIALQHD